MSDALGAWGLLAARTPGAATAYARIGGVAYLALAGLALVTPDLFGFVPIGGNDIWLHALLGIALAAVGFMTRAQEVRVSA